MGASLLLVTGVPGLFSFLRRRGWMEAMVRFSALRGVQTDKNREFQVLLIRLGARYPFGRLGTTSFARNPLCAWAPSQVPLLVTCLRHSLSAPEHRARPVADKEQMRANSLNDAEGS